MPISIISAPALTAAIMFSNELSNVGSPAVKNPTNALPFLNAFSILFISKILSYSCKSMSLYLAIFAVISAFFIAVKTLGLSLVQINSAITATPVLFRKKSLGSRDNQLFHRGENARFAARTAIFAAA